MYHDTVSTISSELEALADEEKQIVLPRFFKTAPGEYGEGDRFMGVTVPRIRSVAVRHLDAGDDDITALLASPWHEMRMCGLIIMVENCKNTLRKSWIAKHSAEAGERLRQSYYTLYLGHTSHINNWDLVDLSCPTVIGGYLLDKPRDILYTLAASSSLWEQRIAVVSTFAFIRRGECDDIYALAGILLRHPHDLMQKAVGWMLREAGKRDGLRLRMFLDMHAHEMPRTMLRYSIEKFSPAERYHYMHDM